ncbi:unnamed protein product [Callosobruchus maculatus]|uniref:PiggyBac transposable element-derived protein domain-containing protein n=1 Tax=Callosobruchus maculatus TaxID=64391 RepID=A0A653DDE8_CALMS|nr:unnamed protein product [Callosobruchus maculatus]
MDDMRCFIGILLLSGYNCVPRRELYWEHSADTNNTLVCNEISRNCFRHMMQNIHCCDNQDDKFAKIRPLIEVLNNKFLDCAPLEEHHCVDKSMIPYYGQLKSRGLKGTGTIRENRLPKNCPIKSADKLRKEQRGSLDFASSKNNELTVCKWHDNNIVSISSNNLKVLPTRQVKRSPKRKRK